MHVSFRVKSSYLGIKKKQEPQSPTLNLTQRKKITMVECHIYPLPLIQRPVPSFSIHPVMQHPSHTSAPHQASLNHSQSQWVHPHPVAALGHINHDWELWFPVCRGRDRVTSVPLHSSPHSYLQDQKRTKGMTATSIYVLKDFG